MKNRLRENDRMEWFLAIALLLLGAAVRLIALGALPYGLNQDEASAGYEAYALLTAGLDRCGKSWPVLFISWGSGQNALMSYFAIPFVKLLGLTGLSIRLPNAIFGCLTLPVFWRMARRCGGKEFGLLALGLLAINPWHIMMSRWALESNLLPFFLLAGMWFTMLAKERRGFLPLAALCFGLSLYAYGTAFFFLPLFLIGAVIWLRKELRPGNFLLSLGIFILIALPITVCQAINAFGLEELSLGGMTLPKLTQTRQAATSVLGGGGVAAAAENFRIFLKILWLGGDGLRYNALPLWKGGVFYFFGLPTAAIGFVASVLRRKDYPMEAPMRLALVCGLLCAFFIRGNINRLNMVWLPLIWFSVRGCDLILKQLKLWKIVPLLGMLVCFLVFLRTYTADFGLPGNVNFFPGLGEAITLAVDREPDGVYITEWVNQPYIFALFYTEEDPERFLETVEYMDMSAAFRKVNRFDGFEFEDPDRAEVLILHRSEVGGREILAEAGRFAVCKNKS